jgi:hypothetical protein
MKRNGISLFCKTKHLKKYREMTANGCMTGFWTQILDPDFGPGFWTKILEPDFGPGRGSAGPTN